MIKRIKHYLFLRKLLKEKTELLWTVEFDRKWFETCKRDYLSEKWENKKRLQYAEESRKDKPNPELMDQLEREIAETKKTRQSYKKTLQLISELPAYIRLLENKKNEFKINNKLGRRE